MNNQEYEEKRSKCWREFCMKHPIDATATGGSIFRFAFDRGFKLGKQFGNSELLNAEGEEMLTVPRKDIQERYAANERLKDAFPKSDIYLASNAINVMLQDLFGSKCLPDKTKDGTMDETKEPKPAEPKFKEGELVKATCSDDKSVIGQIIAPRIADDGIFYQIKGAEEWLFLEKNVEPYNELISQNPSENCDTESSISTGDNTSHESGHLNEDNFAKPDSDADNSQLREEAHKYKIGDLVRARDSICMVYRIEGDRYVLKNVVSGDIFGCLYDDELYPYVDPVELADLVEKRHRVLQFAAMAMQGILSNEAAITYATCNYRNSSCIPDRTYAVAHCALSHALALIEAEKIRYEEYARIL